MLSEVLSYYLHGISTTYSVYGPIMTTESNYTFLFDLNLNGNWRVHFVSDLALNANIGSDRRDFDWKS